MKKVDICGVPFDDVTMDEAVEAALSLVGSGGYVVTPNAEICWRCKEDPEYRGVVCAASLCLPDGAGVIKAARILEKPLKEKVAGVEFGKKLLAAAACRGIAVFILGGKPGVAEAAADNLKKEIPSLSVAGARDGYFCKDGDEADAVYNEIAASGAGIVLCCLGVPAQEYFANRYSMQRGAPLFCCLGGSVDVYAGKAKRAPKIFIKANCEWLYRLIKQPSRIVRMSVIPKYLRYVRNYKKHRMLSKGNDEQ
ncbi:MAG: WecB/TagA/CpsF family glycosyltransferase [Clostridia bacterium]|nr:WecB/TagA/CpsF family glycosyltransferase [Clostridia bacterium]